MVIPLPCQTKRRWSVRHPRASPKTRLTTLITRVNSVGKTSRSLPFTVRTVGRKPAIASSVNAVTNSDLTGDSVPDAADEPPLRTFSTIRKRVFCGFECCKRLFSAIVLRQGECLSTSHMCLRLRKTMRLTHMGHIGVNPDTRRLTGVNAVRIACATSSYSETEGK